MIEPSLSFNTPLTEASLSITAHCNTDRMHHKELGSKIDFTERSITWQISPYSQAAPARVPGMPIQTQIQNGNIKVSPRSNNLDLQEGEFGWKIRFMQAFFSWLDELAQRSLVFWIDQKCTHLQYQHPLTQKKPYTPLPFIYFHYWDDLGCYKGIRRW